MWGHVGYWLGYWLGLKLLVVDQFRWNRFDDVVTNWKAHQKSCLTTSSSRRWDLGCWKNNMAVGEKSFFWTETETTVAMWFIDKIIGRLWPMDLPCVWIIYYIYHKYMTRLDGPSPCDVHHLHICQQIINSCIFFQLNFRCYLWCHFLLAW